MKIVPLFLLMVLSAFNVTAQTIIKGRITDLYSSTPVVDANIMLSEVGSSVALDFTISDKEGEYSLTYTGSAEKITITVSCKR